MPLPPTPLSKDADFMSLEYRREEAKDIAVKLEAVSKSTNVVTRTFDVNFEDHFGFYMYPIQATEERVQMIDTRTKPDFLDSATRDKFSHLVFKSIWLSPGEVNPFFGKQVICKCSGIEWSYHGSPRFLVKTAEMEAVSRN